MSSTNRPAFGYCERLSDAFWAEPLNALSNGFFLLAGCAGLVAWWRAGRRDRSSAIFAALVLAIGIGSFLFHTMPQRWTLLADVVPIQLFAFGYFGFALRRYLSLSVMASLLGTVAFVGAAVALSTGLGPLLPAVMRGSSAYGAFWLGLIGVGWALRRRADAPATARLLLLASGVFAVSLTLRSLDPVLCEAIPVGLHWAWHLLNALVLYLLLRAMIDHPGVTKLSR